jgi:N-acetylneuraminic acid mutarotase
MPTPRVAPAGGVLGGLIYVAGGGSHGLSLSTVEAYDPRTNSWATRAPMPVPTGAAGAGVANGVLHVVGGLTTGASGGSFLALDQAYSPSTNSWALLAPMPTPRSGRAAAVLGGVLFAAGGWTGPPFRDLGTLEAYDPRTNTWATKAPMPTPRQALALVACDGLLFAIGGENHPVPSGTVLTTVEAYDTETDTWTERSPMPVALGGAGVGVIHGTIYVAGGGSTVAVLQTVEAYDPSTDTWTVAPPMPTARADSAAAVVDDTLYVIGGQSSSGQLATNEAFSPFEMVKIDIKPGDPNNIINQKSGGVVPVAILGSATFDPMTVDPSTVTLAGAHAATRGQGHPMSSTADVNHDGYPDLILFFRVQDLQLTPASTEAVLYGKTYGGTPIRGSDVVRVVAPPVRMGKDPQNSPASNLRRAIRIQR